MPSARAWAHGLAEKAPLALRYAKDVVRTAATADLGATYDREVAAQMICSTSADAREGQNAFLERRKPEWKGQ